MKFKWISLLRIQNVCVPLDYFGKLILIVTRVFYADLFLCSWLSLSNDLLVPPWICHSTLTCWGFISTNILFQKKSLHLSFFSTWVLCSERQEFFRGGLEKDSTGIKPDIFILRWGDYGVWTCRAVTLNISFIETHDKEANDQFKYYWFLFYCCRLYIIHNTHEMSSNFIYYLRLYSVKQRNFKRRSPCKLFKMIPAKIFYNI